MLARRKDSMSRVYAKSLRFQHLPRLYPEAIESYFRYSPATIRTILQRLAYLFRYLHTDLLFVVVLPSQQASLSDQS